MDVGTLPASPLRAPWRPPGCHHVALVLQGGGALGAYQAGVYQALHEAGLEPDWLAGVSIGGINSALIAGNPPERRLERLREFWELITSRQVSLVSRTATTPAGAQCLVVDADHAVRPARVLFDARAVAVDHAARRRGGDLVL